MDTQSNTMDELLRDAASAEEVTVEVLGHARDKILKEHRKSNALLTFRGEFDPSDTIRETKCNLDSDLESYFSDEEKSALIAKAVEGFLVEDNALSKQAGTNLIKKIAEKGGRIDSSIHQKGRSWIRWGQGSHARAVLFENCSPAQLENHMEDVQRKNSQSRHNMDEYERQLHQVLGMEWDTLGDLV